MNREQIINHLILQGYQLSCDAHRWAAIWNGVEGRMVKKFERGWDVRPLTSDMALMHHIPGSWDKVDEELARVFVDPAPPKYEHHMTELLGTWGISDDHP